MRLLVVLVAIVVAVDAKRMGLLLNDNSIIKFDSISDTTANTEVLEFETGQKPGHLTGIVFHDYTSRFLAAKLTNRGLCLIATIADKEPEYVAPNLVKSPTPIHHTILRPKMTTKQVTAMAGARISNFCIGYNTYLMVEAQRPDIKPLSARNVESGNTFNTRSDQAYEQVDAELHCKDRTIGLDPMDLDSLSQAPLTDF